MEALTIVSSKVEEGEALSVTGAHNTRGRNVSPRLSLCSSLGGEISRSEEPSMGEDPELFSDGWMTLLHNVVDYNHGG